MTQASRTARAVPPPRRGRGWSAALTVVLLVLVTGCGRETLHPATLKAVPPKDPPTRSAPAGDAAPAPEPEPTTTTPPAEGLLVDCVTVDIDLPKSWESSQSADQTWSYTLPEDAGGGVVKVAGTPYTGADAHKSQADLEALVRGKDSDTVGPQVTKDGMVYAERPVRRGNEWRLAKAFPEERSQLVTISYAPAGSASDTTIEATKDVLAEAAAGTSLLKPGECGD
ncbi:hypothetical protein [Actinopolymorpha alba]|uniref:hypothetical protein n=1 Tax=Actinopolymorpha alba TaxID=533267 RepID=UPI00037791D5|nr:hypothetical protein [Actinopolymorpha alba]